MQRDLLEELYLKYYSFAYLYTFSLCKNKEIAEDIVSESFHKALISLDKEIQHFQYWLLTVCKNLWIDYVRKHMGKSTIPLEEQNVSTDQQSVVVQILQEEKNRYVYEAILKLPSNYQEILVLHYYNHLPLGEIAKLMNLSPGNAKTLICRARNKLKLYLEESNYGF